MGSRILKYVDFERANALLEGFNKATGFVTAILDLDGNILSKSGWRQICTDFHRRNLETALNCTVSDTELASKLGEGERYHFYKCINGLIDVAVPIVIRGEHIANLYSGQFFFEAPDVSFFIKQAQTYGFDEKTYLEALKKVPVVSNEKVEVAMEFLLNITQTIIGMTADRLDQIDLIEELRKREAAILESQVELKQKTNDLLESQRIYRAFIDASADMIFLKDEQFRHIVANRKLAEFFNKSMSELIGKTDHELMPEDVANQCREADVIAMTTKTSIISEETIGDKVYETTKFPVMQKDNKVGVGGFVRDITERKQKEIRISQLNRLYATLSQINQTIVHINDQDALLKSVCNMVIEFGKYRMAWIGLVNQTDGMVYPIAFSGEEQGYLSETKINYHDDKLGNGPTGTVIREERCVISRNIATDANMLAWQKPALQRGYISSAAIPIYKNGQIFCILSVYSSELNGFTSEDEGLLVEVGGDISFALDKLEIEENRRHAVAELKQSEEKYSNYIRNAPDGVIILDEMGQFIEVNIAATEITGYTIDELVKMNIIDMLSEESLSEGANLFGELVETGSVKGTLQYRHHEGSTRWLSFDAVKLNDHRYLAFARDITSRIKIEEELKENEEKYRLLYTSMSQGLALHEIITNEEGEPVDYVFLDINESYTRLLGVTREMCIGKRITEVMPNVEQYWIDVFGKVALTGEPKYYENYLATTGGYYATYTYSPKERQFAVLVADMTERKSNEEKLNHLSYHDQLTGLYNRRFFEEELKRLDKKRNVPISIIMADINGLKVINDSFGHNVGDEYLIRLAEILKTACRADEIIARLGGDEFGIILTKTDTVEAAKIVKRLKDLISKAKVGGIVLSVSFGYDTKENEEQLISEIIVSAENHMYTHKIVERTSMRSKTVEMIMSALFEKSDREAQHSQRVSEICEAIATKMDFDIDDVEQIRIAGLVHDIGKIGINEGILNRDGCLKNDEWAAIKKHPEAGWRILNTTVEFAAVAQSILHHHEKFDGSGYPNGLKGEEIPIQARVIAIADAYDAMTSVRSYRNAISHEEAIIEIKRCSGTHFDPAIVDAFVK